MTPAAIIRQLRADGVMLALTPSGSIKASGAGAAVNRWLLAIRENKPGIVAALQEAANDPAVAHRHWWIHFPDQESLEVIFAPEQTQADVLALYPAAIAAEPLPDVMPEPEIPVPAPLVPDDRRPCRACLNLTSAGRCLAAARGEMPYIASRDYSPVRDQPKRCEGYQPKSSEADQRIGTERWPEFSGGMK